MYAAAGGASLASRQARMRQKQQKKNQQKEAKLHPPKAPGLAGTEHGASTPTRQSRQFHQLPTSYLRAPQSHGRKLSASYTAQSKLLLPIDEGDTQSVLHMRMHSHAHLHPMQHSHLHGQITPHQTQPAPTQQHHAIQGSYYQHFAAAAAAHGRVSPKLTHRHSGSSGASFYPSHLPRSATATVPLVSQMEPTPPATPLVAKAVNNQDAEQLACIGIPEHDSIIVTPATPIASPGHVAKLRKTDDTSAADVERQPLTAAEVDEEEGGDVDSPMQPPHAPLERKCSVYRMRRSDADEYGEGAGSNVRRQLRELQLNNQQQYEPLVIDEPQIMFKGLPNGRKFQPCAYCEEGICVCEHIECAQGRAAWLERGRRCSVQEREQQVAAAACHRRWVKRNRIQDASLGGSSDEEDFLGVLRGPSTFANAFLYVGLGTVALGLVIAFVGTGEKGFKTVELRLIGPSLIVLGLVCCILRILFCICPSHCIASRKKTRKKNGNKVDADHTTSLLRGESKRVSIARGPQPRYPITHKRGSNKMLNEGMEALRQLATTSLFMQNEQKPSTNRVVPIIKEPENPIEAPLEMKKLGTELSAFEIANDATINDESFHVKNEKTSKTIERKESTRTVSNTAVKLKTDDSIPTSTTKASKAHATTTIKKESTYQLEDLSSISKKESARPEQKTMPTSEKIAHQPNAHEKSQSLSSSSTVRDSIDGDQEMETSLTATKLIHPNNEGRTPGVVGSTDTEQIQQVETIKTVEEEEEVIDLPPSSSAISRLPSSAGANTTTTSVSLYDFPPSTPHSYASSMRTEPPLIRGPLGMPLAQLTASTSAYTMPFGISSKPTTPTLAAKAAPATTTTISLLPLPAPPLSTTASIPGQIIEPCENVAKNPIAARLSSPKGFTFSTPGRYNNSGTGGVGTLGKLVTQSSILASARGQASATTTETASTASSPLATSLHLTHHNNKLEPELLLSPAKLGQ